MRKFCLIMISCFICYIAVAQQYYNEWIDYSKTYYKFKIGSTGLYHINQNNLPAALQNVPAEQFQLWRNGKEIALYTSVASGILPANGYIEFYGERNDGLPDRNLYKDSANQLSTRVSLETDTAVYFLTANTGNNLRLTDAANNVTGTTLQPEQSFIYHYRYDFENTINRGRAVYYGTNVWSSTYDVGEWWCSGDFYPQTPLVTNLGNLYASGSSFSPQLTVGLAGNSIINTVDSFGNNRIIEVKINGSTVISDNSVSNFNAKVLTNNSPIAPSLINTASNNVTAYVVNTNIHDHAVVCFIDLAYSRLFNFGGASQFAFSLPATTTGNYLKITNFGGGNAVLFDLTNNKRYVADASVAGTLQFVLPPSASDRNLVLLSEDFAASATGFTQHAFLNYTDANNQADYLIISNKVLIGTSPNGPVQQYAAYRNSSAGGGLKVIIYDIDDLVDEFAYGIKQHPLAVKNFLQYARNKFTSAPKFAFLVGKAVTYNDARLNETSSYYNKICLVPTFGWPASDNILASNDLSPLPATPIGRLSAVTQNEVSIYLSKIKEYEAAQQSNVQTVASKAWMKTIVHVAGADDPGLNTVLTTDLNNYKTIVQDTLFGGHVYSFNKTTSSAGTTILDALLQNLFSNGISLLNYFGHSSANILDYNLNKPEDYNNAANTRFFL